MRFRANFQKLGFRNPRWYIVNFQTGKMAKLAVEAKSQARRHASKYLPRPVKNAIKSVLVPRKEGRIEPKKAGDKTSKK